MNVFHSIVCKGRKAMPQNNNNIKQSPSLHSTNIQEEHIIQPKNHQRTYQSDGNIRQSSASTRSKAKSLPDNASRRPSLLAMIYNAMISRRNNSGSVKDSQQSMDGSSQASFHQQMRQFNHSQPSNKWTLQFLDMHTETKFWIHFTKQTLLHWRYTVLLMTVSQLGLFAAAMLTYSAEHVTYMSTYAEKAISIDRMFENMSSLCIKGYWCSPCPPGDLCEPYSAGIDSVFMAVLTVVSIISVWLSFRLQLPQFSRIFLLQTYCLVAIIVRFHYFSRNYDPLYSDVILIVMIAAAYCGLQISILWAYWNISATLLAWMIYKLPGITDYRFVTRKSVLYLAGLLSIISINTLYLLYRFERHHRKAYLQLQYSMWASSRLRARAQLVGGAKIDIEAPLEKSLGLLKDFVSDQTLSVEQRNMINSIIQLLNSPQLLSPDIQGQLQIDDPVDGQNQMKNSSSKVTLDEDQRMWILREIAKQPGSTTNLVHRKSLNATRKSRRLDASLGYLDKVQPMPELSQSLPNREVILPKSNTTTFIRSESVITVDNNLIELSLAPALPLNNTVGVVNNTSNIGALKIAIQFVNSKINNQSQRSLTHKRQPSCDLNSLLNQLDQWDWKLLDFASCCPYGKSLFILTWHLFESNGLFEEFNIPIDKFQSFMWRVQESYRDLPYHNQLHVTDVLHAVHCLTKDEKIQQLMTPLELMALLFATAIHDLDHPGVNNTFLVTTASPLAIVYNDRAVLENYHVSSAFEMLLKPENNFLSHLNKQEWQSFREMVVDLVLATDLSQHYSILTLFKTRVQSGFNPGTVREDRLLLFKLILKCADVSNPTKELSLYTHWIQAVLDEWRLQGDQERRLNLPISPFMDRENANVLVSSQTGFIDFIVQPLYDALNSGYLPVPFAMINLENNRQHWQRAKDASMQQQLQPIKANENVQ